MAVTVYKSNDTGATTLDSLNGGKSLINILKACLVNGYGAKAAAGWTIALEDAPNNKIIFRNSAANGTGRYFRFQENGVMYNGHGGGADQIAVMRGCESYTDIDTTAGNFPNVDGADTSDDSTYYGVSVFKASADNNAGPYPWIVFADDRTCYVYISYYKPGYTDPFDSAMADADYRNIVAFGDFTPFNDIVDPYAAMVIGNGFNTVPYSNKCYFGRSYLSQGTIASHYMNRGMEGNAGAIEFSKGPMMESYNSSGIGGKLNSPQAYDYMPYPSPVSGGVMLMPIVVQENTNAVERTIKNTYYPTGKRGFLRGVYATPHTCSEAKTDRLGYPGDTFTVDGRTYMVMAVNAESIQSTCLFDITGPW